MKVLAVVEPPVITALNAVRVSCQYTYSEFFEGHK